MAPNVTMYGSSMAATTKMKYEQERLRFVLAAKKIAYNEVRPSPPSLYPRVFAPFCPRPFVWVSLPHWLKGALGWCTQVDVSEDQQARQEMMRVSGGERGLPQLHVDGRVSWRGGRRVLRVGSWLVG